MDKYLILIKQLEQQIKDLEEKRKINKLNRKIVEDNANIIYEEKSVLDKELEKLESPKNYIIQFPKDLKDKKFISIMVSLVFLFIIVLSNILALFTSGVMTFTDKIFNIILIGYSIVAPTTYYFYQKYNLKKSIKNLDLSELEEEITNKEKQIAEKETEHSILCEKADGLKEQEDLIKSELEQIGKELTRVKNIRDKAIEVILKDPSIEILLDKETIRQEEKNPKFVKH